MKIQKNILTNGTLVEIFAEENMMLDIGENVYSTYICVPITYDISTIKEITYDENLIKNE